MKIRLLFSLILLLSCYSIQGQYLSSQNFNLGALYGFGKSEGPAIDQSSLYGQGTYHTKTRPLAFTFNFTTVTHKKGLHLGPVFSFALGGSMDRFMAENLGGGWSNSDGVWRKDFGAFIDWKIGLSLNYTLPKAKTTFGIRYFNWYQGNCFGATYNNSDDAAAIGAHVNWQRFGITYSYGSAKIPGILVDSKGWNSSEVELRYQLVYKEKTSGGVIIGIRSLSQKLIESNTPGKSPDTKGNIVSCFVLFH